MSIGQLARYLEEEQNVISVRAENLAILWGGATVQVTTLIDDMAPSDDAWYVTIPYSDPDNNMEIT